MNTREFTELLKGCRPVKDSDGNIIVQSIMNMQLVCLTTDKEYSLDERFANPLDSIIAGNRSYGEITFRNKTNKEVILPTQMAVMTKQNAQNHGMVKAGYIPENETVTYHDAGCVEGSRGGHFSNTNEFRMIPVSMREMLFNAVGNTYGHSNIYPAIRKLGLDTESNADTYLDRYFSKYDKKLEQFIAHFERPRNLIGVIVFIDGEIITIDKFPSFTYAEQIWDLMIRDCYGSLAIISELQNKQSKNEFTEIYNSLKKKHQGNFIELLEKTLKKTKQSMTNNVNEKIQELLDLTFETKLDSDDDNYGSNIKSFLLKNEGYLGQVITESDYNHLVSVVRKDSFNPDTLRQVNELRRKARKQKRFEL